MNKHEGRGVNGRRVKVQGWKGVFRVAGIGAHDMILVEKYGPKCLVTFGAKRSEIKFLRRRMEPRP
jgi:hypothetical protein